MALLFLPRVRWVAISLWSEMNLNLNADLFLLHHLAAIGYLGIESSALAQSLRPFKK